MESQALARFREVRNAGDPFLGVCPRRPESAGLHFTFPALAWQRWGCLEEGPRLGQRDPMGMFFSHLKQPVALKKTSGSTISRAMLLLPSHQPEKGMMTRSASTGRASAMSSSFSSSVEDRFQSSPGGWGWSTQPMPGSGRPQAPRSHPQPALASEPCGNIIFQVDLVYQV